MKPVRKDNVAWVLLTLVCYAVFVSLFITAAAYSFDTDPYHFLQLQS